MTEIDLNILPQSKRMLSKTDDLVMWMKGLFGACQVVQNQSTAVFKLKNGQYIKYLKHLGILRIPDKSGVDAEKLYAKLWMYDKVQNEEVADESELSCKLRKTLLRDVLIIMLVTLVITAKIGSLFHVPDIVWCINGVFMLFRLALIRIVEHDEKKGRNLIHDEGDASNNDKAG